MGTEKIKRFKDAILNNRREISLERARLYTESWKRTEGMPVVIRRAEALKHILENCQIVIQEDDLLVGNRSALPRAGVASPEMSPYWIQEELDFLATRPQDQFDISEADKSIFRQELFAYWEGRSLKDQIENRIPEHVNAARRTKIVKLNQTDKGQGHIIPSYERLIAKGLPGLIEDLQSRRMKLGDTDFLKAADITLKAFKNYVKRHIKELDEMTLKNTERAYLKCLKSILERMLIQKPETFHEAVQLFWLINVALQHESNASSISCGRFDQYMYPFYKKALDKGEDSNFLRDILTDLYLKMNTIVALRSSDSAKYFAGFPIGYNTILGGVDIHGDDATNELSYLMLDIFMDIKLPQPNLGVRISEKSPDLFLMKTAEIIRLGTGIPQIFNDEVIIPSYLNRGVSLDDARNYGVVGCVELSLPGKTYGLHDIALFNLLRLLEITLQEEAEAITDFDQLLEAVKKKIDYYVERMVEGSNIVDEAHAQLAPTPLLSTLIDGCIESGKDLTAGGAVYNFSGVQGIGTANLADALMVIKKVVFEERQMDLKELVAVLDSNYQKREPLRQAFINKYEKFGNDIDEVDYLGKEILSYYCRETEKYTNVRNGIFHPGSYTVSAHIPLGEAVGATADGRFAKEQLADGGLSPMVGRDLKGPTASLKSVGKLDNILTSNGSLLNVKFSPDALKENDGLRKLVAYFKAFMRLKIQHIQFNVVSVDTLRDAQNNPENYRDLVVRVAGYSAMFAELNKAIQDDIIHRREHQL